MKNFDSLKRKNNFSLLIKKNLISEKPNKKPDKKIASWKRPFDKIAIKKSDLSSAILEEREDSL